MSKRADEDLTEIYRYSYQHFGEVQADAYLLALHERCLLLANQPDLGRRIDYIREGYYRMALILLMSGPTFYAPHNYYCPLIRSR